MSSVRVDSKACVAKFSKHLLMQISSNAWKDFHLDLSNQVPKLGPMQVIELAEAMQKNTFITSLDLSGNDIVGDNDEKSMLAADKLASLALKKLNIKDNPRVNAKWITALRKNKTFNYVEHDSLSGYDTFWVVALRMNCAFNRGASILKEARALYEEGEALYADDKALAAITFHAAMEKYQLVAPDIRKHYREDETFEKLEKRLAVFAPCKGLRLP